MLLTPAAWCGPCKLVAPVFEKLSEEYKGKATFISVDLDEAEEISNEFNVTSVPTILFFKAGELVHTLVGGGPAQQAELKTKVAELTA